ncbi:hypothetical protein ACFW1J_08590 [Priestia aryabhattai]|nr:hypothetical protein [Priestia aryabhattai]MBX9967814.1 hypothetical protein [Priestia aryabhattai]
MIGGQGEDSFRKRGSSAARGKRSPARKLTAVEQEVRIVNPDYLSSG